MDSKDQEKKSNSDDKQFSIQPIQPGGSSGGGDAKFAAHQAQPGPAVTKDMPAQEGSKDDRKARKEALNK